MPLNKPLEKSLIHEAGLSSVSSFFYVTSGRHCLTRLFEDVKGMEHFLGGVKEIFQVFYLNRCILLKDKTLIISK